MYALYIYDDAVGVWGSEPDSFQFEFRSEVKSEVRRIESEVKRSESENEANSGAWRSEAIEEAREFRLAGLGVARGAGGSRPIPAPPPGTLEAHIFQ